MLQSHCYFVLLSSVIEVTILFAHHCSKLLSSEL